jgi:hypothetical protein
MLLTLTTTHHRVTFPGRPIIHMFVDGKTKMGPWARLCGRCHNVFGVGIGTGLGQQYVKRGEHWVKVAG